MHRRSALAATVSTAVGVLVGATALAGPAAAERPSAVSTHRAATTPVEHQRIVDYWTPERMKNAKDGSQLVAGARPSGQVESGSPTVVPADLPKANGGTPSKGKPGGSTGETGGRWTAGGEVVRTTGKVFLTLPSGNYVCSGSAVNSTNESTVLTAGHCVSDSGRYATNWAFVPAYDDNVRPYGTWTANTLSTTTQWLNGEDFNYDLAFATMNPLNGVTLTDTVGGQGIGFNLPRGQEMAAFGFPAARPYDGSELAYCRDVVFQDSYYGSQDQGMSCNMTGGSSGGPWLAAFNGSTGTLNSVNSFRYRGIKNVMWGPYFGSVAQDLYTSASR